MRHSGISTFESAEKVAPNKFLLSRSNLLFFLPIQKNFLDHKIFSIFSQKNSNFWTSKTFFPTNFWAAKTFFQLTKFQSPYRHQKKFFKQRLDPFYIKPNPKSAISRKQPAIFVARKQKFTAISSVHLIYLKRTRNIHLIQRSTTCQPFKRSYVTSRMRKISALHNNKICAEFVENN